MLVKNLFYFKCLNYKLSNMKINKLVFSVFLYFLLTAILHAQHLPVFDTISHDAVIVNSGLNFLMVTNVSDGDTVNQQLNVEVSSSDSTVLKVDSVSYETGGNMALIWVTEQGVLDSAILTVTITDPDGSAMKDFKVEVIEYTHHGIKFEIHDAVFWREVVPLGETPIFDSIIQSTNMTAAYNNLNWDEIPLTVSAGCGNPTLCDGHDFSTGFLEGFLVPKITGNYHFYINGDTQYALFLSSDENFGNAEVIAANSDNHGKIGETIDGRKSAAIQLDSGKVYAIYAAQWNVHHENGGIKWELPGTFEPTYIDGHYLYPEYDTERPENVTNVKVTAIGDEFINISWDKSTDNQKLEGYNVYLNGSKVNEAVVPENRFLFENLTPSTSYSIAVTAVDLVNNESLIENILNVQTLEPDTVAPMPPTILSVIDTSGLALKISWEGATDEQSSIFGYNIYVDGELYNTDSVISTNSIILKVLGPSTEYNVEIESIDAGMNVSEKSQVFVVSTSEFDPLDENLGLKTGKLILSAEAMSFNEGLGINPDYKSGAVFNPAHTELLEDLKPGAIRWGALTANPLSFSDYTGAGKSVTIGKFINRCNEFNSFTAFCCGVENSADWRQDPETFVRFIEYINGPDDTPGGQLRVEEGFTEPFLKNSPGIIFEFGNEVWGASAHNAQIGSNYVAYAEWCREMALKMKSSPYYDSTKMYLAYSSRYPAREQSYGLNEKLIRGTDGEVEWTAPSGYLGGNLDYDPAFPPADSELEYYQNVRNRANLYLNGMISSHKYEVEQTGRLMEQYMYESNTTTPTYNGRLGQALLSTDYYLSAMERGSAIPTIFHLTGGQWRITEPENDYRRLPLFLTAKYVNHFCKGDVLYNTYQSNQKGTSEQGANFNQRPVGAHTYLNEQGYSIVLISRDYVNDYYVQVDIPDDLSFNQNGNMYSITGPDFSTKDAAVDTTKITVEDEMIVKVPKYGMVLIHFEINNQQMENLPLAYYPYPRIENIVIPEGNYSFTEQNENKRFNAEISPSGSWDKKVEWTLLHNSGNYGIIKHDTYCIVYSGSNLSNETDSMILRASSRAGDVIAEVVLYPDNTVNTGEIQNRSNLKLYPNPANDVLNIELEEEATIRIINVNGSTVIKKQIERGHSEINIAHIPQGLYTIKVGDRTKRLVIRH